MKELIKPNHVEARYDDVQGFALDIDIDCGVHNGCRRRNRCETSNGSDGEVMDEILF